MFQIFSPSPKFLTKTTEFKEWFLKPEVKRDGPQAPYWAQGAWWSLPRQQQKAGNHSGVSRDPILILHGSYVTEMPVL